jgi:DNA-binding protein YbaB
MVQDVKRVWSGVDDTQRKLRAVTGTAWSPDRLIRIVVGPRGQLVELDIDPRVYRNPNSKALAAAILATARLAVEDAAGQVRKIIETAVPSDLRAGRLGGPDFERMLYGHDADVVSAGDGDG